MHVHVANTSTHLTIHFRWHVCTGADIDAGRNDPNHFTAVTQEMATTFTGKYVYNANNDCNSCSDTCGPRTDGGHTGTGCNGMRSVTLFSLTRVALHCP